MRLTKIMDDPSYGGCGGVILAKCENCTTRLSSCYEEDCGMQNEANQKLAIIERMMHDADGNEIISLDRLRELAEAEREGRIRIISDWTPCAEGMPIRPEGKEIKRDWYIVTLGTGIVTLRAYEFDERSPFGYGFHEQNIIPVVAWQPLPEPYNPDHIRDTTGKVKEDAE